MKSITLSKTIQIQAEATAVYSHLAHIANHRGLLPLVVKTRGIGRGIDDGGHTVIDFSSIRLYQN